MGHPRTTLPPELILKLELVQPTTQQSLRTVWDPSSIVQDLNRSGGESPAPLRTSGIQREATAGESKVAPRYLLSKQMANHGRGNKGQREECS
jgi:hypothetical protein